MKLGILGLDVHTSSLLAAAMAAGHSVEVAVGTDSLRASQATLPASQETLIPARARTGAWEALLDEESVDAVIAARCGPVELFEEQLRKLVQSDIPLLVSHPVSFSPLLIYELDMIRRERGGWIDYYHPARRHPLLAGLSQHVAQAEQGPLGSIEQVVFQRWARERDRPAVLAQLACDVDTIAAVCGTQDKIGALGSPGTEAAYSNLGVQMSGPSGIVTRWSVGPPENDVQGRLTVIGGAGRAILNLPGESHQWTLTQVIGDREQHSDAPQWDAAAAAIDELQANIGKRHGESSWFAAAQAIEMTDAATRSLERGRTIELHFDEYSPEATFRGRMATVGCALLLLAMCLLCVMQLFGDTLIAGLQPLLNAAGMGGIPVRRFWPLLIAIPLIIFAAIQLLPKLLPDERKANGANRGEGGQPPAEEEP